MRWTWLIAALLVCAPLQYAAADPLEQIARYGGEQALALPDTVWIVAEDAAGYLMALGMLGYHLAPTGGRDDLGWNSFVTGEPLELVYPGPLSSPDVDPLKPAECPEGVDPAAAAALANCEMLVRSPYGLACPWPGDPSGELFTAELPGGGQAYLRLPAGKIPAQANAVYQAKAYALKPIDALRFARQMIRAESDDAADRINGASLEAQVAWCNCHSLVAHADGEGQKEAFFQVSKVLGNLLDAYRERHGSYPGTFQGLTKIPGGVIARLPWNPYDPTKAINFPGLGELPHIEYTALIDARPDGTPGVMDYQLVPIGIR